MGTYLKQTKNAYFAGIDIDEKDVMLANKKLDAAYCLNIEHDSFEKLGKFDVVVMADVIEHLVGPATTLKRLKNSLRPKGRLIFSIPNMSNVPIRLALMEGSFTYGNSGLQERTHLHFYDKETIIKLFEQVGYQIETTDNTIREIPKNILKN